MKYCWLLPLLLLAVPAQAQHVKYDTYTGFSVESAPVLPAAETHPSLYFTAERLPELRARKGDQGSRYFTLWLRFRADALKYITKDATDLDENDRPRAAKTLAFWWLIEDDPQALQKAIDALLLAFEGIPQTGEKPYDEIYRATWLQNYAVAYDWVHGHLTSEQDAEVRRRLGDEAQYLRANLTEGDRLAPRPHNHRSKPAWAIGTAALALNADPRAADWLQYALEASNTVTRYQFSADGIYREGGHYWMYNAVNLIPFLWHYKNVSDVSLFEAFQPSFEWPIRVRTGRGWIPNIEDSYLKPAPTHMVAAAYHGSPTALSETADFAALCQWNYDNTVFFNEDYTGATVDATWEIDEYILYDSSIEAAPPTASPTQLLEGGQVVFRNAWTHGPDDRYLLFHGVAEADNHNHPDQLSFFLGGKDAILAPDAGYGPSGFSDDRRNSWYTTARAHNIATADGYPPFSDSLLRSPFVYNVTPPTPHFIDSGFFDFAEKQSGFLRPSDVDLRRAIGFVDGDYFAVADLLTGSESHTYRTYLHGRGRFALDGRHASWETFANAFGEAARLDAFFFPSSATLKNTTGYISLFKDERFEQFVEATQTGERAALLQLLLPAATDAPTPTAVDLSTDAYTAAALQKDGAEDVFLLQHDAQEQTLDAFTTDATFAWARTTGGETTKLAVRGATTFRAGDLVVTTDRPVTFALDLGTPGAIVLEPSGVPEAVRVEVAYPGAGTATDVRVNGSPVPFDARDGRVTFEVGAQSVGLGERVPLPEGSTLYAYPNPFQDTTTLVFELARAGSYRLDVFDLLGRRVGQMLERPAAAGRHEVRWDGRGPDGASVPAGVYLLRLTDADGRASTRAVVRLR